MTKQQVYGGILGVCVGDALGVPVEFRSREYLSANPVRGMIGHGMHNQPPGTWSDDSSLTLCLVESLCAGYDPADVARGIVRFATENHWTPYGRVFDIGSTTERAVVRLIAGERPPWEAGPRGETDNGNGSLMRILPIAYILGGLPFEDRMERVAELSSLTHGHPRALLACTIYVEVACELLGGRSASSAYDAACQTIRTNMAHNPELVHFRRIVEGSITDVPVEEIKSEGYVVHTLEAALWSLLTAASFTDAVLTAVNLGGDSDTTGAVTGGLAGICYGSRAIPRQWIDQLARRAEIEHLIERFREALA